MECLYLTNDVKVITLTETLNSSIFSRRMELASTFGLTSVDMSKSINN